MTALAVCCAHLRSELVTLSVKHRFFSLWQILHMYAYLTSVVRPYSLCLARKIRGTFPSSTSATASCSCGKIPSNAAHGRIEGRILDMGLLAHV